MQSAYRMKLHCDAEISWRARSEVARCLNGHMPGRCGDLELLVSELVTNGYEHGRPDDDGTIELRVAAGDDRVRVEVLDAGSGFAFDTRRPEADADTSFGLFLVERVSDAWGFDVQDGRTRVWFELGAPA
jgi:anti-sigma regulatory factor (Ser/Thr protein kinase)